MSSISCAQSSGTPAGLQVKPPPGQQPLHCCRMQVLGREAPFRKEWPDDCSDAAVASCAVVSSCSEVLL